MLLLYETSYNILFIVSGCICDDNVTLLVSIVDHPFKRFNFNNFMLAKGHSFVVLVLDHRLMNIFER